jgi:hypothetical protein
MKCATLVATAIGILSWTPATDIVVRGIASATADTVVSHDPALTKAALIATQLTRYDVLYYKTQAATSVHFGFDLAFPVPGGKPLFVSFAAAGVVQIYYDEISAEMDHVGLGDLVS